MSTLAASPLWAGRRDKHRRKPRSSRLSAITDASIACSHRSREKRRCRITPIAASNVEASFLNMSSTTQIFHGICLASVIDSIASWASSPRSEGRRLRFARRRREHDFENYLLVRAAFITSSFHRLFLQEYLLAVDFEAGEGAWPRAHGIGHMRAFRY